MNNYEYIPTGYEKQYHQMKHQYLYTNPYYYKVRAELARKRYFNKEDINKKVLEFGVGLGHNISTFKKAVGYDISKFAVDFCTTKGILTTTKINKIFNNYYDIVLSVHVLEHVENPLKTLRVIHSKLRKDGKLILITPIDKFKKIGNWELDVDINQHLWTWTPQLMINLLNRAGFKVIHNEIISTCGYKKLLFFRKFGLRTYDWVTKLAGIVVRDRELKIVAVRI